MEKIKENEDVKGRRIRKHNSGFLGLIEILFLMEYPEKVSRVCLPTRNLKTLL